MTQVRTRKRKRSASLETDSHSKLQHVPSVSGNDLPALTPLIQKDNGPLPFSKEDDTKKVTNASDISQQDNESLVKISQSNVLVAANELLQSVHLMNACSQESNNNSQAHQHQQEKYVQNENNAKRLEQENIKHYDVRCCEEEDAITLGSLFNENNDAIVAQEAKQTAFIVKDKTKKPKERNYKQVQNQEVCKQEAKKYRNTEKYHYEQETVLFLNTPLSTLRSVLLTKAFTRCNWALRECKYSPAVLRLNAKKGKWPNPWETGNVDHILTLPPQQECKDICRIRFKGCNSVYCMKYAENKKTRIMLGPVPCTASLDVTIHNAQPATCTVKVQGEHHLNFFPDINSVQLTKVVRAVIGDEAIMKTSTRDGYQQLQDKNDNIESVHGEDETYMISKRMYSQMRSDLNRKQEGSFEEDFSNTLKFLYNELVNHTEIAFVESICGINVSSMSLKNFALILYNKKVVKDNIEVLKTKVSCDSNYKLIQLQVRPRERNDDEDEKKKNSHLEKAVLTFISIETVSRNSLVAFAMISSTFNETNMRWFYKAAEQVLLKHLPASEVFVWAPLWMIDKGSVELAFMSKCNQLFIICKFHSIKIWTEWCKTHSIEEEVAKQIVKYFYKLYNCNTKETYLREYNRFKEDKEIPNGFKSYYDKNWHSAIYVINDKEMPFYYFWTGLLRDSNFGSNGTDNISEIQFAVFGRMSRRDYKPHINRLNTAIQFLVRFLKENRNKTRWKHDSDNSEVVYMRNSMKDYKKYTVQAEEGVGKFTCINAKEEDAVLREVDLFHMNCTCAKFVYSGRPCVHMYACILFAAKQYEWKVYSNQPFNLLYLAHLWYHDKNAFTNCREQCNLAYPLVGPGKDKNIAEAEDHEDPDEYEIEKVYGMRLGANNVPELYCKWKGFSVSDNCWATFTNSNSLVASEFFMDFCDWFKRTYNCSVRDESSVANVLPICSLVFTNEVYKADFGENCNAVADHSSRLVMANRKQLTAFFKQFSFEAY